MGAFDSYNAVVACPSCGDQHWIDGQTKIFDPDYDEQRWFELDEPRPAAFGPEAIAGLAADGWVRIRDGAGDARFTLLADFDDLYACDCGFAFAVLLHFELAPGTITMRQIELLDARTDIANRVDFAEAETLWAAGHSTYAGYAAAIAAVNAQLPEARARWLRERLDYRFQLTDDEPRETEWTSLIGPTQCEACGDVRERRERTLLTHPDHPISFFGALWTGGVIFLGDRIPFFDAWLADDVDRGWYFRARHPVGTLLRVLGQRHRFGCRCGAGRARTVAHFARRHGGLELVELTMRVVRTAADLHDIDFIEGHSRTPRNITEPHTREYVLAWVLA